MSKFTLKKIALSMLAVYSFSAHANEQELQPITSIEEWKQYIDDAKIETIDYTKGFYPSERNRNVVHMQSLDENHRKSNSNIKHVENNEVVLQTEGQLLLAEVEKQYHNVQKVNNQPLPVDKNGIIDFVAITKHREGFELQPTNVVKEVQPELPFVKESQSTQNSLSTVDNQKLDDYFVSQKENKLVNSNAVQNKPNRYYTQDNKNKIPTPLPLNEFIVATTTSNGNTKNIFGREEKSSKRPNNFKRGRYYGPSNVYVNKGIKVQSSIEPNIKQGFVNNELSIGVSVSNKKSEVENLYEVKSKPTIGVNVRDTIEFKVNDNFSHSIRLNGNVDYHKDDIEIGFQPPIGRKIVRNIENAKWLQYETSIAYIPILQSNIGSIYPMIGSGYQYTKIGTGNRRLNTERTYMEYGLGVSKSLSPYQNVFLEGTYQKDINVKSTTEYNNFIPQQTSDIGKGEKYNVELGLKTNYTNGSDDGVTLSVYHSQYKNKNDNKLVIPTIFGNYEHNLNGNNEKEIGVKINFNFN